VAGLPDNMVSSVSPRRVPCGSAIVSSQCRLFDRDYLAINDPSGLSRIIVRR